MVFFGAIIIITTNEISIKRQMMASWKMKYSCKVYTRNHSLISRFSLRLIGRVTYNGANGHQVEISEVFQVQGRVQKGSILKPTLFLFIIGMNFPAALSGEHKRRKLNNFP